ncbi:MAG: flagellar biosynthesis protein FlhB [Bacteriovoracia bacterium]
MAEYEERSLEDLTEEPSQHRIEELRRQGVVPQSRELTSTIVLFGVVVLIYFSSAKFMEEFTGLLKQIFSKDLMHPLEIHDWRSFVEVGGRAGKILLFSFLPIGVVCIFLAVMGSAAQVGFLFSSEAIEPKFDRIDPIAGFRRVFSMDALLNGGKSLLKFFFIVGAVYLALKPRIVFLPNTLAYSISQLVAYIGGMLFHVIVVTIVFLFAVAGLDYFMQWRMYRRKAMMTKTEAKQEQKEREGDPQIKARIRSIQRDMARKRMMKAVPKADVIITNPTHIAIAIQYKPEDMVAPKVLAKGADFIAQRIKEIARQNGIPTVENKPLARTLYKNVKVGQMIPRSLYQAVAEVLAYVYRLKGKRLNQNNANPGAR